MERRRRLSRHAHLHRQQAGRPLARRAVRNPEDSSTLPSRRRPALYMHPYAGAKMVATLAFLHGRRVYLNLLAGGFKNDLVALGDDTPHDERYDRTVEYAQVVRALLTSSSGVSFAGRYYTLAARDDGAGSPGRALPRHPDLGLVGRRTGRCPRDRSDSHPVPGPTERGRRARASMSRPVFGSA